MQTAETYWFQRNVTPSRQRCVNFITQTAYDAQSIATCNEILMVLLTTQAADPFISASPWICPASRTTVDWSMWQLATTARRRPIHACLFWRRRLSTLDSLRCVAAALSASLSLKQTIVHRVMSHCRQSHCRHSCTDWPLWFVTSTQGPLTSTFMLSTVDCLDLENGAIHLILPHIRRPLLLIFTARCTSA